MSLKPFFLFIALLLIPVASALTINNTVINSTGLNISINITYPIQLSELRVYSDHIYFKELTNSHPNASAGEALSINLTTTNISISGTDLPYWSEITNTKKVLTSNVTINNTITTTVPVQGCNYNVFTYVSNASNFSASYSQGLCSGNSVPISIPGIEVGNNIILLNFVSASNPGAGGSSSETPSPPPPTTPTTNTSTTTVIVNNPSTSCNIQISNPISKKIYLVGAKNTISQKTNFVTKNSNDINDTFLYTIKDVNCALEATSTIINGDSAYTNNIQCQFPEEETTQKGTLIIKSAYCDKAIEIQVSSNKYGKFVAVLQSLIFGTNIPGTDLPGFILYGLLIAIIAIAIVANIMINKAFKAAYGKISPGTKFVITAFIVLATFAATIFLIVIVL